MDQIIPRNFELEEHVELEQLQSHAESKNIIGHVVDGFVVNWLLIKV